MQVTVETTQGLERRMRVEIPEERVRGEIDKRLGNLARSARIPGFRPGKAPVKIVARHYGRQVRDEVVGGIVQESLVDALEQEQLRPAAVPRIAPLETTAGVSYTATFDVLPDISLPQFETMEIARPVAAVADEDVDRMLETMQTQRRTWTAVERAATSTDRVVVDLDGFVDGEPLDEAAARELHVELDAGRMVAGFEAGLVGVRAGEDRTLALVFPESYPEHLAGKPATFEVKVHRVEEPAVPDVDDAFAESFGVAEGGVDALRGEVRANMERELAGGLRAALKQRVMEALVRSGALDHLGPNRATLMKRLPDALKAAEQRHHNTSAGQDDLFSAGDAQADIASASINEAIAEWRESLRLDGERETLGLYLTGHPIEEYRDELAGFTCGRIRDQCEKIENGSGGGSRRRKNIETVAAGLIVAIRSKNLNNGGKMGIVTLDDQSARIDVVIGSELFEASAGAMQKDAVLVVSGELGYDDFGGGYRLRAKQLMDLDAARRRYARRLRVNVDNSLSGNGFLDKFQEVVTPFKGGDCPIIVHYTNGTASASLTLGDDWRIEPCTELLEKLHDLEHNCKAELIY